MNNTSKTLIISIVVVIIVVVGAFLFTRNNSSTDIRPAFVPYTNTQSGYQLNIPADWGVQQTGSSVFVFPEITGGNDSAIEQAYRDNSEGITIVSISASTTAELDEFFESRFFERMSPVSFERMSDHVVAVKSVQLPASPAESPAYGYNGLQYALKTTGRILIVNVFAKTASVTVDQQAIISEIVATLKEI